MTSLQAYHSFRRGFLFLVGFSLMALAVVGVESLARANLMTILPERSALVDNLLSIDLSSGGGEGPRLRGIGCKGASGPLFAEEESDFPPCVAIVEELPPTVFGDD